MSKREAKSFAAVGVDVDAPRAKRRKEAPATSNTVPDGKQDADATNVPGDVKDGAENAVEDVEDRETVREKGLRLWQTVKDAVNKEGQIASFQFMRLPSKRQYPDYYIRIKHPIALDDIKAKLDGKEYQSLKDVRQDFETCFRNAKRFNMKESQIWKDAKFLHKLVMKEYSRITGIKEEGHDEGDGGSEDEDKKKKAPTAYRLLKTRLQKLVDKADDKGRVLSVEFMELPSRKMWPMYYNIIKRPQCLENIFRKLKRKEYPKPVDFANDVELVFSNALEFNQEHTQIWEDAVALREYFRKLMSDLPEPYSIPAYANVGQHPTKIKLRVPQSTPAAPPPLPIAAPAHSLPSSNSITVRTAAQPALSKNIPSAAAGPSHGLPIKSQSITPAIPSTPAPASPSSHAPRAALAPTPAIATVAPQVPMATQLSTLMPPTSTGTGSSHSAASFYSNAVYQPPALVPVPSKASSISPASSSTSVTAIPTLTVGAAVTQPSLTAAPEYAHPLKNAIITALPHRRKLVLDHTDGVRIWSMRLNGHETAIVVSDVTFLSQHHGEEDESSGDDEPSRQEEEEEEEEEAAPVKKRKKRGPGRPRKRARTTKAVKKSPGKGKAVGARPGEVQVKLNGVLIPGGEHDAWEVHLPFGVSVLEVGEKGGMVWKVYLDRASH